MKIDFVITWVDGNDENWQNDKNKYMNQSNINNDSSNVRYRDWDILKYWFRGVEKFAPWVNKIHFVTYGHIPEWLNICNPKINIVKHTEFIPEKYLPTFNSHTIENNLHKIKGLSENFVYFNDDMFILKDVREEDFFKNRQPCDSFCENALTIKEKNDIFPHILLNNMSVINSNFNKRKTFKKNKFKYLNFKYGKMNFRTIALLMWSKYSLIYDTHIPVSLCKKTLTDVWEKEFGIFDETCKHKFRSGTDVSQYVFRYWQMLKGEFYPRSFKFGKIVKTSDKEVENLIEKQKYKILCINDDENGDFKKDKQRIQNSFEKILMQKSNFEK